MELMRLALLVSNWVPERPEKAKPARRMMAASGCLPAEPRLRASPRGSRRQGAWGSTREYGCGDGVCTMGAMVVVVVLGMVLVVMVREGRVVVVVPGLVAAMVVVVDV
jgi:hypothetical protein